MVEVEAFAHQVDDAEEQFGLRQRAGGIAGDFRGSLQFDGAALRFTEQVLAFYGD